MSAAQHEPTRPAGGRQAYQPPVLRVFGSLSELTAADNRDANADGGHGSKSQSSF